MIFIQYRVHIPLSTLSPFILKRTPVSPASSRSFSFRHPVNKAKAGDYLTFIRFRGESASLTGKEARVEPRKRTLWNVTASFRPLPYIFRRSCPVHPFSSTLELSTTPRDTDSVSFLPVIELTADDDWTSCCRFDCRSLVTSERTVLWYSPNLYAISYPLLYFTLVSHRDTFLLENR